MTVDTSVCRSESRMREHAAEMRPGATKTKTKEQRELKTKRNEWRITKMVLAIFLSFLICYLPITIVKVADKDVHFPGTQCSYQFHGKYGAVVFYARDAFLKTMHNSELA
jgi:hypothetical protein